MNRSQNCPEVSRHSRLFGKCYLHELLSERKVTLELFRIQNAVLPPGLKVGVHLQEMRPALSSF